MKKFLAFVLSLILTLSIFSVPAIAEKEYGIEEFSYQDKLLTGKINIPENGVAYARITIYLENNYYVKLFLPIMADGVFELPFFGNVKYITVAIVDDISWNSSSPCVIYDVAEYFVK